MSIPRDRTVNAAVHVCKLLAEFRTDRTGLNLQELTDALGLSKPSVHALAGTLVGEAVLRYDARERTYRLGPAVASIASAYRASTSLVRVMQPFLERLQEKTGESAALHVREGREYACIAQVASDEPIRMELKVGQRFANGVGAAGKAMAAVSARGARTSGEEYARIRKAGYAVSRGDVIEGAIAIYAPLHDVAGDLIGAVGVHGPAFRIPEPAIIRIAAEVTSVAAHARSAIATGLPVQ